MLPASLKKAAWWSDVVARWAACLMEPANRGGTWALSNLVAVDPGLWKVKGWGWWGWRVWKTSE